MACDAGIVAVLSHKLGDEECPNCLCIAPAENYSQIDKEALAIVFVVRHFHQYLYDCSFTIKSDHKPLQHLFGKGRGIPAMAPARVHCWALTLSAYVYGYSMCWGKNILMLMFLVAFHSRCNQERYQCFKN